MGRSHPEDMEAPSAMPCCPLAQHRQLWLTPALLRRVQNEQILPAWQREHGGSCCSHCQPITGNKNWCHRAGEEKPQSRWGGRTMRQGWPRILTAFSSCELRFPSYTEAIPEPALQNNPRCHVKSSAWTACALGCALWTPLLLWGVSGTLTWAPRDARLSQTAAEHREFLLSSSCLIPQKLLVQILSP